jgi:hypothetical protein
MASLVLLATQANNPFTGIAASAETPVDAKVVYEVSLKTNTSDAIVISGPKQPDYDAEVLVPLRAAQAEARQKAEAAAAAKAASRKKVVHRVATTVVVTGSHADWMAAAGIAESDFGFVDYIIGRESGWGVTKSNYAGSGAYGLGQAMPAGKMAAFGSDYLTNPTTQLKWANAYAKGRYGSWANAYSHWLTKHNW